MRDLPGLLQGRYDHGCSYYNKDDGTKVSISINYSPIIIFQTYLVSGGRDDGWDNLSSTEILEETASAWVLTGELPSPRRGLRGANIDNRMLMTGKW